MLFVKKHMCNGERADLNHNRRKTMRGLYTGYIQEN